MEALYSHLLPKLRGPNPMEVQGQNLFVVPGDMPTSDSLPYANSHNKL